MMILASQGTLDIEIVASEDSKNYFLRESVQCLHSFETYRKPRLIRTINLNLYILLTLYTAIHTYKYMHIFFFCYFTPKYFSMHL